MKRPELFFALSLAFVVFNSCQKSEMTTMDDEIVLSKQETQVEEAMSDVDLLVSEAITLHAGLLRSATTDSSIYLNDCPAVTINAEASPKVMTIDFGTACTGKDGKVRSGKIIVTAESFTTFPSVRQKSFENYFVDQKKMEGSIVQTIVRDTATHIRTATIQEDVTITFPENGGTAHRVTNITRQYQPNILKDKTDNQTVSWGNVVFTRTSGVVLTKAIAAETPLVYKAACGHIVSGIVSVSTSTNRNWTLDYGNGACDDQATMTRDGKTKEITIR